MVYKINIHIENENDTEALAAITFLSNNFAGKTTGSFNSASKLVKGYIGLM